MSPAVALEPSTACDEIDAPPSLTAVQFAPSPPFARLKLSVTVDPEPDDAEQATATVVTFADPTVPDPFDTEHDCPDGFVFTVTAVRRTRPPTASQT